MPLLLFDMPVDSPGCTNLFFFEVTVCAFITSLFFLFFLFKDTFYFFVMPLLLFDMHVDSPECTNLFLWWSSVLFITGFIFQSQSCFCFLLLLFFMLYFTCHGQSRIHQPFFFYMIFFPWLHAFYTRLFSKSLASCPFQLAFFFFQSHWLLASFNRLFSKPLSYKRWHLYLPAFRV